MNLYEIERELSYLRDQNKARSVYIEELEAKLDAVAIVGKYANRQADMAQSRLLKNEKLLYDDTYWQPVLDKIRFELIQIAGLTCKEMSDD